MPNMDGLTMVEKVRNELGNKTVNVIMLTWTLTPLLSPSPFSTPPQVW